MFNGCLNFRLAAALLLLGVASAGCKKDPDQALVVFQVLVAPGVSAVESFKFSVTASNVPVPAKSITDKKTQSSFWVGYYMPGVDGSVTILGEAVGAGNCTIGSGTLTVSDVRAGQTRTVDASAGATLHIQLLPTAHCAGTGGAGGHSGGSAGKDGGASDAAAGAGGDAAIDAGSNGDGPAVKADLGAACHAGTECGSGFCVDGICCENSCSGSCEFCGDATMPGKCVAVTGAPRGTRAACAGAGTMCGGSCDGTIRATCTYAATTQECRPPSCASNMATLAANCDGKGACPAPQTVSCGANVCAGPICSGGCSATQPCGAGNYCAGGVCMPKKPAGQACSAAGDCASGFCVDGFCCNTACTGSCQACNLTGTMGTCGAVKSAVDDTCNGKSSCDAAGTCKKTSGETCATAADCTSGNCVDGHCCGTASCGACQACTGGGGTCVAVTGAEDPGSCSGTSSCDGTGMCKLKAGQTCTTASQCASGYCADHVCCNTGCAGQCESCAQTGSVGTCTAVKGAAAHGACAGAAGTCGGTCDGTNRTMCAYPTTSCRPASCTSGTAVLAANCDGKGSCPAMQTQSCGANSCAGNICAGGCSSTQPCANSTYYCNAGMCMAKKGNGTPCGAGTECTSNNCADGVCCDSTCGATCFSCLGVNTGRADGICAAVKAGIAHGSDCGMSNPTTCGFDSKCDGAGACRRYAAGTNCGAEACTDRASTSMYTSARTCDGHGTCLAPATSSCDSVYRCSGTKCRTACGSASDCVASAYCSNNTCVAKKPDGQPCASATECSTGVCGGRCCAAGCTCTQHSSANRLKDPGIDVDVSNWKTDIGTIARSLSDAERCPYSGSLAATADAEQTISQCVHNTPFVGAFNFGVQFSGNAPICQVTFYSGFNCDGDDVLANETGPAMPAALWQSVSGSVTDVRNANSALFSCYIFGGPATTYLDMFYLSSAPAQF